MNLQDYTLKLLKTCKFILHFLSPNHYTVWITEIFKERLFKGRDSIILSETDMVIPGPFSSFSADSVIISFSNKRQVSYSRNSNLSGPDLGTGVFNLENYTGYQKLQSLASSNLYRLVYEIDARDYEKTNPEYTR